MYKVGVVGCGRIASIFDDDPKREYIASHIGAYQHVKDTEIVAVCDINEDRLKKCQERWGIQQRYIDYKEMLTKERVDILSVCTPPESHYQIVREAIKDKNIKAIFCEKPIADTVKDAEKMVKLCREKNIILQIGHQRRFDELHRELRESICKKNMGEVQQANFYYTAGINNTGSHMVDLLRFFFGGVSWAEAFFSKSPSRKDSDPNLDGILKFKDGLLVTFQACDAKKYLVFELNCFLEKARFVLKDSGFSLDFYEAKESKNFSGYKELYKMSSSFAVKYKRNFMVNAVNHLVECIKSGKNSLSSGEDGLADLKIINAVLRSAENNGKRIVLN